MLFCKKIDNNANQQFIEENDYKNLPFFIEGLTFYNYPNVDGSTSTAPFSVNYLSMNTNGHPGVSI